VTRVMFWSAARKPGFSKKAGLLEINPRKLQT
jgi:hypothetical protein